MWAQKPEGLRP